MEEPMNVNIFKLEEYLTKYEFSAPYLLCCSDAESFSMQEIINLANNEEAKLWNNLRLQYTEPYGLPQLRTQIASRLYPSLSFENILCFSGAEEGIFASLSVLCEPNDNVIVLSPCYQSLMEIPKQNGATVTQVILKEENQWRIDLKEIELAIRKNTKCIVMNFPHNPTGQVISQKELNDLITLCAKYDLWLFSDEVYRLLGKPEKGWSYPAATLYPKAISLGVMSKAFGMAGLRVGWIACQDKALIHKIKLIKDYLSICNSAPSEILSLIALNNMDKILKRNNQIVEDNLKILDPFMQEYHDLFEWIRPKGGCVGFVKYKGPESIENFCDKLVKEKGVLLLPSTVYDYKNSYFRIGFGRKTMPEALNRMKDFLKT